MSAPERDGLSGIRIHLVAILDMIDGRREHHAAERMRCIKSHDMDRYGEHIGAGDELRTLHRLILENLNSLRGDDR